MLMGVTSVALASTQERACFLAYPRLHDGYDFPQGWKPSGQGDGVDAVILTTVVPDHALKIVLNNIRDPLVPIVSFAADDRQCVDAAGQGDQFAWTRAYAIQARLRELPPSIRHSTQPEDILLARMYSRDQGLDALYDSSCRGLVRYPVAGPLDNVSEVATGLFDKGFLVRSFFDRIHCCPQCRSGHLSVREECHSCRSPNIREEVVVHHFQCAHEAPESQFRTGSGFECPKCARPLRHIGLDYDKPGSITRCHDCGSINDKPTVGFKCIDCGAHYAADQVPAKTWYSYNLTPSAIHRIFQDDYASISFQGGKESSFQILLDHAQREQREFGSPYQVASITFAQRDTIAAENIRLWEQSMLLMSDVLRSALREVDAVQERPNGILVLMPRTDAEGARRAMEQLSSRIMSVLKIDPGFQYTLVDDSTARSIHDRAA
ncbi:hypothetical protein [Bosea lathyri]|uniref:Thaumarchaeal output domain-containing protein n=1 Tax=Bosea lathyri TaxID=1036778 RepID=A0A1H6BKY4_9HYPH|nr:hypothetical protein [Bosea lathyri]SEG61368.1 hypothetical protein SAMN04488115_107331 [Bosea lathyri]